MNAFQSRVSSLFATDGASLLGWCVSFEITDFELDFANVQQHLVDAGLPSDLINPTRERGAYLRAVKAAVKSTKTSRKDNTFRQRVAETADVSATVIARAEATDLGHGSDFDATFDTATKISYNKSQRTLQAEGEGADEIKAKFDSLKKSYTGTQWRTACLGWIKKECAGIGVRRSGGVYFVPISKQSQLESLVRLSDSLGIENFDISLIPIVDISVARTSIVKSSVDELQSKIEEFSAELEEAGKINNRGATSRVAEYQDLKTKVETYEFLLGFKQQQLHDSIAELTKKLQDKLNEV
jgi:hypothetical protein